MECGGGQGYHMVVVEKLIIDPSLCPYSLLSGDVLGCENLGGGQGRLSLKLVDERE